MNLQSIESSFKDAVCREIQLRPEGIDRFVVFNPFTFSDGDNLTIVLRKNHNHWLLTDEGHTLMHLTYAIDEKALTSGTRMQIIDNALSIYGITENEGELIIPIENDHFGAALFNFIQGLIRITDVSYFTRERVKSTFLEDFRGFMSMVVPENRRTFDWHDPAHDRQGNYSVDCRLNGGTRQLFVFALPNDEKTRDATISLLQFEKWGLIFESLAIFEDQENINRKVLARFSDVGGKQFSSLFGNQDKIEKFVNSYF